MGTLLFAWRMAWVILCLELPAWFRVGGGGQPRLHGVGSGHRSSTLHRTSCMSRSSRLTWHLSPTHWGSHR